MNAVNEGRLREEGKRAKNKLGVRVSRALAAVTTQVSYCGAAAVVTMSPFVGVSHAGGAPMAEFFVQGPTTPMYVQHWRANAFVLPRTDR